MNLEVRNWDSTEVDIDRNFDVYGENRLPKTIDEYCLLLCFEVGVVGELGGDNFSVIVLSYDSAQAEHGSQRRKIVLPLFDVEIAKKIVKRTVKFVGKQNPSNWGVALSKYFHWEFENMQNLTSEQVQEMKKEGLWEDDE